ncbi:hypothetical protein [Trujillonella endophytica]|uniref:Uncharacterized protein n=1 Tax=Trujillonella endophytica TaxID=673521 RepID=A0A1H8RFB7_9ACTN|nr:hypothetical protein [Trujillella endophytica]SEO64838.1 hypothetical protein SAMN05660991_01057 [Trujillella endophytica]
MTAAAPSVEGWARVQHLPAALVAAVGTALLVLLPDQVAEHGTLVAVVVLQAALVAAWVPATGVRGGPGVVALGVAAAVAADLRLVLPEDPELGELLVVPGVAFAAAVLHQMLRRPPRGDVVGSLAGALLLVCAVCGLAVLLRLPDAAGGNRAAATAALVVGAALVAAHLVDAVLPRPQVAAGVDRGVLGLLVALLAGVAVAMLRHAPGGLGDTLSSVTVGLVLAGVAALVGLAGSYVVAASAGDVRGRAVAAPVLQAVLPIAACAPVAFALALRLAF